MELVEAMRRVILATGGRTAQYLFADPKHRIIKDVKALIKVSKVPFLSIFR